MQLLSVEELVARARALCVDRERTILGLVGAPGAGKSTAAQHLVAALPEHTVNVPMDGYHLANAELRRLNRVGRKGAPDTFDSAGYVRLLERLRAQRADEVIYAPEFRRDLEEPIAGAIAVPPDCRLVVTEGNYLLLDSGHWSAVRALVDEIWFIDIDPRVRLERLIARHMRFGRDERTAREWVARTDEPNAALIEVSRARADVFIRLVNDASPVQRND